MKPDRIIVDALRGLTGLAKFTASSGLLGEVGSKVARYAAPGLGLVADLVKGGFDPVVTIERIRTDVLRRELGDVSRRWEKKQDELFGQPMDPVAALGREDIYEP